MFIKGPFQLCENSVDLIPLSCSHVRKQSDVSDIGGISTEFQSNFDSTRIYLESTKHSCISACMRIRIYLLRKIILV